MRSRVRVSFFSFRREILLLLLIFPSYSFLQGDHCGKDVSHFRPLRNERSDDRLLWTEFAPKNLYYISESEISDRDGCKRSINHGNSGTSAVPSSARNSLLLFLGEFCFWFFWSLTNTKSVQMSIGSYIFTLVTKFLRTLCETYFRFFIFNYDFIEMLMDL